MCGMTRRKDIDYAIELGVDAIGLIFYQKSTRFCSLKKAQDILKDIPPFVNVVAVLVNPEFDSVTQLINELQIDLLQFHGDEEDDFCKQFSIPFIKAVHPYSSDSILNSSKHFKSAKAILLDTPSPMRGGTGFPFNWELIPDIIPKPFILAGGLNELNLKEALNSCRPYAVDVCSGIELAPGIKDPSKMNRFMSALREINNEHV